jgi:membrane protein implicated in regulation of membrane protease activity
MSSMFWAIIAAVFLVLELIIPGLVTVWFGLAGIVMIFLAPVIKDLNTEFYIFAVLSFVFLLITRPIAKKYLYKKDKDDVSFGSRTVGRETKITKILDEGVYEVILDEKMWRGISADNLEINDRVTITGITGNKLVLEKKINKK